MSPHSRAIREPGKSVESPESKSKSTSNKDRNSIYFMTTTISAEAISIENSKHNVGLKPVPKWETAKPVDNHHRSGKKAPALARILLKRTSSSNGASEEEWSDFQSSLHQCLHVLSFPIDALDEPISGQDWSHPVSNFKSSKDRFHSHVSRQYFLPVFASHK